MSDNDTSSGTTGRPTPGHESAADLPPGSPLAGLTSVTQLNDYADQLGGKLYDADHGYITTEQNTKRLDGYGISLEYVVSSEAAELAQLKSSY